jgi:hypothetical protein
VEEAIILLMQKNEATVWLLQKWPDKDSWNTMEAIGVASVAANVYNGIETLLELLIKKVHGREISGAEWHKAVIFTARELGYIPDEILDIINGMRDFRHVKRHGYDLELNADMVRANAPEAVQSRGSVERTIKIL